MTATTEATPDILGRDLQLIADNRLGTVNGVPLTHWCDTWRELESLGLIRVARTWRHRGRNLYLGRDQWSASLTWEGRELLGIEDESEAL